MEFDIAEMTFSYNKGQGNEVTLNLFLNEERADYLQIPIIITEFAKTIFVNLPSGRKLPRCLINEFFPKDNESNEWFDALLELINGKEVQIVKIEEDNMN